MSAGAALSLAGALLQALTRNPLADTGVLGINAGAAFFAALMLSLLGWSSPLIFVVMAIVGATAAITVTYRVALGEKMA
jgi:transport system permease protein